MDGRRTPSPPGSQSCSPSPVHAGHDHGKIFWIIRDFAFVTILAAIIFGYIAYRSDIEITIDKKPLDMTSPSGQTITMIVSTVMAFTGKIFGEETMALIRQLEPLVRGAMGIRIHRPTRAG